MSKPVFVFLFPGQGSQYVGMGRDFYEAHEEVRKLFEQASTTLEMDMVRLCFEGPEDELVLTHNVQPAITLVNMVCCKVLGSHGVRAAVAAGHSLGEYSGLHAAGVIDEKSTLELVRLRGQRMQAAADEQPGAMAAILNLDQDKVDEICKSCHIEMANYNSPGQVIVSGTEEGVLKAMDMGKEAGAKRCVRLNVSGPWHSRFMEPAQEKFQADLAAYSFQDPEIPIVANVDAAYISSGNDARENLVRQLCSPVQWHQSMERLIRDGHHRFVEVGPKKVLRGLLRQIDKQIEVHNVEDPPSLEAFLKAAT